MIYGPTPFDAIRLTLNKMAKADINALLQLGIKVVKQEADGIYLVTMGKNSFRTKSEIPLTPGKEYWVDTRHTKSGMVSLARPHPKPLLLKKEGFLPLQKSLLEELANESDPVESIKNMLLQMTSSAQNKEQFQTLVQLLFSLQQGVVTLPFEERGKRVLLQLKKDKKNETLKQKSVKFYAAFNNIGPVEGTIVRYDDKNCLDLEVFYPKTARLLEGLKKELKHFSQVSIALRPSAILPFWESDTYGLLDMRG